MKAETFWKLILYRNLCFFINHCIFDWKFDIFSLTSSLFLQAPKDCWHVKKLVFSIKNTVILAKGGFNHVCLCQDSLNYQLSQLPLLEFPLLGNFGETVPWDFELITISLSVLSRLVSVVNLHLYHFYFIEKDSRL